MSDICRLCNPTSNDVFAQKIDAVVVVQRKVVLDEHAALFCGLEECCISRRCVFIRVNSDSRAGFGQNWQNKVKIIITLPAAVLTEACWK